MRKVLMLTVILIFSLTFHVYAAIPIADMDDFTQNSSYDPIAEKYTFNPGEYKMTGDIDLTNYSLIVKEGSSLSLDVKAADLSAISRLKLKGLEVSGGTIITSGFGSDTIMGSASGIHIESDGFIQESGTITATGSGIGTMSVGYGIHIKSGGLLQKSGTMIATGSGIGIVSSGHGIHIKSGGLTQEKGTITAFGSADIGGSGYGIYVGGSATFSDTLIIAREKSGVSISVNANGASDTLLLKNTSTLTPVIDLAKSENQSGLIASRKGITVETPTESTAKLKPLLKNTARLVKGAFMDGILFMQSDYDNTEGHTIVGEYETPISTITMSYEASKIESDEKYVLKVTRDKTPEEAFKDSGIVSQDDIYFAKEIYDFLIQEENKDHKFNLILDEIDNSFDIEGALSVVEKFKPTKSLNFLIWRDIVVKNMSDSKRSLLGIVGNESFSLSELLSIEFGSYKDIKVLYGGIGSEGAYKFNKMSIGAAIKFMPAMTKSASETTTGFNIGAIVMGAYNFSDNTNLALNVGYSYSDIDISRIDAIGEKHEANTSLNLITASIDVNHRFNLTKNMSLSIQAGLEYYHMILLGYVESNQDGFPIVVEGSRENSIKPKLQLALNYTLGLLRFEGNVHANYELLPAKYEGSLSLVEMELYSGNAISVNDAKLTFGGGLSLSYGISEASEFKAVYSFYKHGEYKTHKVGLGFEMGF